MKVFYFFNDCTEDNGPHHYIDQSHRNFSVNGKRYYSEEEVFSKYHKSQEIKSIVKKGTVIIEDTRGLHKAGMPKEGFRDLGYAVFSPLTILGQAKVSYYSMDRKLHENLSSYQKKFIPRSSIH